MNRCPFTYQPRRWIEVGAFFVLFTTTGRWSVPNSICPWDADCVVEQLLAEAWLNE